MKALEGKKIAIAGAGPGGLTLARLLQQSGAQVSVYERDQSRNARVQGSALDLHEGSGLAALEAAGLTEITADTIVNTEMFYAANACERVVALFRSFVGRDEVSPAGAD